MKELRVRLEFIDEVLGTASADQDLYRNFIASKAPDAKTKEEEVADIGVDESVERGMTIFPKEGGVPFLYDYQIKGFFKNACGTLKRVPKTESAKMKAYKKIIDGLIFVNERKILLHMPKELGYCQRPLRAQTAQGERVALAISEAAPEGTWIEFTIKMLSDELEDAVREWLDYGELNGIGQWHNSGKGRFRWKETEDE